MNETLNDIKRYIQFAITNLRDQANEYSLSLLEEELDTVKYVETSPAGFEKFELKYPDLASTTWLYDFKTIGGYEAFIRGYMLSCRKRSAI